MTTKPETEYTKTIKYQLTEEGNLVFKINERYRSGFPDLIVLQDGIVKFVEVKIEDRELTELQKITLHLIARKGGHAYVLRKKGEGSELYRVKGDISDFKVYRVPLGQLFNDEEEGGFDDAA